MAATLTEIAKKANVSVTLVSRLFSNDPTLRVSPETRLRILNVKDDLGGVRGIGGSQVELLSPSVSTAKRAHNFVVPMNRLFIENYQENVSVTPFLKGLEEIVKDKKFRLSTVFFDEDKVLETIKDMINSPEYCDGLFFLGSVVNESIAKLVLAHNFPHVCIDPRSEVFGINTVCDHHINGIRKAISHLQRLGHRRVGYFGFLVDNSNHYSFRYSVFKTAINETGVELGSQVELRESLAIHKPDYARKVFGDVLDKGFTETAIICQTDAIALGAIAAMKERGLEPGKDISIIGHDNIEQKGNKPVAEPILTTIDTQVEIIGRRCGELLLDQVLYNRRQIVHEFLPVVELIVRKTTGPCPK